jgi:8-oxo-dGTP pyrophosphatase MutT (NUDIX family)
MMITRHVGIAFAGGAAVFPGGRVDAAEDSVLCLLARNPTGLAVDELMFRVAAVRETFEEDGILLSCPRGSEALYMLQRIRDEAHRFAITYHRQLRGKRMTKSVLDDIKGLGPTRRKRLTRELGGVAGVKDASLDDLRALSWLPDEVAVAIYGKVHGDRVGRGAAP